RERLRPRAAQNARLSEEAAVDVGRRLTGLDLVVLAADLDAGGQVHRLGAHLDCAGEAEVADSLLIDQAASVEFARAVRAEGGIERVGHAEVEFVSAPDHAGVPVPVAGLAVRAAGQA